MSEEDKKRHAMTSFALFGGMFLSPRGKARSGLPSDKAAKAESDD